MEKKNDEVIKTLNELIEVNLDRAKGYETAANGTEDSGNKALFQQYSLQSMGFKNELEKLVIEYGGEPTKSSSASGTVYRAWIQTKSLLTGKDKKAILSSCEFGEDEAKKVYTDARQDATLYPDSVLTLIDRQYDEILKAHNTIKSLRDALIEQHH
jgi:uncharacterized protein (TIGR02284 family)